MPILCEFYAKRHLQFNSIIQELDPHSVPARPPLLNNFRIGFPYLHPHHHEEVVVVYHRASDRVRRASSRLTTAGCPLSQPSNHSDSALHCQDVKCGTRVVHHKYFLSVHFLRNICKLLHMRSLRVKFIPSATALADSRVASCALLLPAGAKPAREEVKR